MSDRKEITIQVDGDINLYLSDVLCWLRGYLANKEEYSPDSNLLEPAIGKLLELNTKLKDKLL